VYYGNARPLSRAFLILGIFWEVRLLISPDLGIWLPILFFILGLLALILEVFILPGFGVSGVIGIILIGWGIVMLSVDFAQTTMSLTIAIISTILLFVIGLKISGKYGFWQKIILGTKQMNNMGYSASATELINYLGRKGIAITPLRPSGIADISGNRLDVITSGEYISAGTSITVIRVEGVRVIVKAGEETLSPQQNN
jgi:membrane-bound ClpP family serine protease